MKYFSLSIFVVFFSVYSAIPCISQVIFRSVSWVVQVEGAYIIDQEFYDHFIDQDSSNHLSELNIRVDANLDSSACHAEHNAFFWASSDTVVLGGEGTTGGRREEGGDPLFFRNWATANAVIDMGESSLYRFSGRQSGEVYVTLNFENWDTGERISIPISGWEPDFDISGRFPGAGTYAIQVVLQFFYHSNEPFDLEGGLEYSLAVYTEEEVVVTSSTWGSVKSLFR